MLTIGEVAQAVTANRAEFGRVFLQAQAQADVLAAQRQEFEAVVAGSPDGQAFERALQYAQAHGFFDVLVDLLAEQRLENGHVTRVLLEEQAQHGDDAELQAVTDRVRGFEDPDVIAKGVADGIRWTTRVLVDGQFQGTGILIAPHLVLTAWHVVKQLFTPDASGEWEPLPDGGSRLTFQFDDFLARVSRSGSFQPVNASEMAAHKEWCVAYSSCHSDELSGQLPADLAQLRGRWDYALIRLAHALSPSRSCASLDPKSVVPRANEKIFVFQHPAGHPLKLADDVVAAADATLAAAIPAFRFLHYANTVGGSSGGPCFDKTFALFGFHQGEWKHPAPDGRPTNRGVPIVRVLEHVRERIGELPPPDPSDVPLWRLGPEDKFVPVVGTESFQSAVWRSAIGSTPRLLVITGQARSGKTFRADLISAMLPAGGHLMVVLRAEAIAKMNALDLAAKICSAAGAPPPVIAPLEDANSTPAMWLKSEVANKIVGALSAARKDRRVWLILTDLNLFEIEDPQASQLLLILYEQVATLDWLRIVLDGMRGDLPLTLSQWIERHRVPQVTLDDIQSHFRHFREALAMPDSGGISDVDILVTSKRILARYQDALDNDAQAATAVLTTEVMKAANDYLEALTELGAGPVPAGP